MCALFTVLSVPCSLEVTCWEKVGSHVCDVSLCYCHFPIWCPWPGVVFDCINS